MEQTAVGCLFKMGNIIFRVYLSRFSFVSSHKHSNKYECALKTTHLLIFFEIFQFWNRCDLSELEDNTFHFLVEGATTFILTITGKQPNKDHSPKSSSTILARCARVFLSLVPGQTWVMLLSCWWL